MWAVVYFLMVVFRSGGREEHSGLGGLGLVTCSRSKIRATSLPKPPGNRLYQMACLWRDLSLQGLWGFLKFRIWWNPRGLD